MRYVSTRGAAPVLGFDDVLLAGLATDGGLYLPERWPPFAPGQLAGFAGRPYAQVATEVMAPFVEGAVDLDDFAAMVASAYATFDHPDVVPLRDLGGGLWLAELFHGPTLAFKDLALQLVGRLFDHVLTQRGERVTIVGATSGDTGSAAIEACRDRDAVEIFILHPEGRVSEVQRRQMTTVLSPNVHNLAVRGSFDDCQGLVKALFADEAFRTRTNLSAVNSINWARVMAQVVYYVTSGVALGGGTAPVAFTVPTGNFGNVFAGYAASRMGLPVSQVVLGTNENDILARFLDTGTMQVGGVRPTLSPSMDIQISSNFERLLFELEGRDGAVVAERMLQFRDDGQMVLGRDLLATLQETWSACRIDDAETLDIMRRTHEEAGVLVDPHTAVGLGAAVARRRDATVPMVTMATAHPAKFPDAVERATGIRPPLPPGLADLLDRPERFEVVDNDLGAVRDAILAVVH